MAMLIGVNNSSAPPPLDGAKLPHADMHAWTVSHRQGRQLGTDSRRRERCPCGDDLRCPGPCTGPRMIRARIAAVSHGEALRMKAVGRRHSDRGMTLADGTTINVRAVAVDTIRQHGEDALLRVAQLADQALDRGDIDLQRTLIALIHEIEAILNVPPAEGVH
jgi:hypothetical protein